jgi:hypothetical protein
MEGTDFVDLYRKTVGDALVPHRVFPYHSLSVTIACIKAMEQGLMDVHTMNNCGCYLWEYTMSVECWIRICALQPDPEKLWTSRTALVRDSSPQEVLALTRIEYLWENLDVVEASVRRWKKMGSLWLAGKIFWIEREVQRRRQVWHLSIRRAWLLAVVSTKHQSAE